MAFLVRQFEVWHFRRRVPKAIRSKLGLAEIYRTLNTSCKKVARVRAALLFAASEQLFQQVAAAMTTLSDDDLRAAARQWLRTSMWRERLKSQVDDLLPGDLREQHDVLARRLVTYDDDFLGEHAQGARSGQLEAEEASAALVAAGYREPDKKTADRMHEALLVAVQQYVDQRMQQVFHPESVLDSVVSGKARKPSPLFSKRTSEFLDAKGYSAQARRQNEVTFRLWIELVGDRPCRDYTGEDADGFRDLLLKLPSSHGKGGKIHAREAIERADKTGAKRMTMKTVKRHFSALSQYWIWLKPKASLDGNIFSGFTFPGTKSAKKARDVWSHSDLERLFRSPDWTEADADSAWHWLPLVSLHSGLRLEEACRLRPCDVEKIGKIWCLRIRDHPDGWSPKTEAGERDVPVHSWLISHGFLELAEKRRSSEAARLWPELKPGGPDGRLGFDYSRKFSKTIRALAVGPKTTFHSFRHTFRTMLDETDHLDRHLAAVGGWERVAQDEGSRRYAKQNERLIPKLKAVVEDFRPPVDLDALLAR